MSIYADIKADLAVNEVINANPAVTALKVLFGVKSWAIVLLRIVISDLPVISSLCRVPLNLLFQVEIGKGVTIGKRLFIPHPTGIIIARGSCIGDDCSIYQRVTFAEKNAIHKGPVVGDKCVIGTGSVLIGNITLGSNVRIGANSVVISDIEANSVGFGNPLIVKKSRA